MPSELRPNKTAFILTNFVNISTIVFLVFVYIWWGRDNQKIFLSVVGLLLAYHLIAVIVQANKERYIFSEDKITYVTGSIFSDSSVDLAIRNVTYVSMQKPFVQRILFGTGNVNIQSAGTTFTEVTLKSIENSENAYEKAQELLRSNGFRLSKKELLHDEHPSQLAVVFESVAWFFFTLLITAFIFVWGSTMLLRGGEGNLGLLANPLAWLAILLISCTGAALHYINMKRRHYQVYSDAIVFTEGFLTYRYTVIPAENISDSSLHRTLVDRLFGLYDVVISCQGTEREIVFANIENGEHLSATIDSLARKTVKEHETKQVVGLQQASPKKVKRDMSTTGEYRMVAWRAITPVLLWSIVILAAWTVIEAVLSRFFEGSFWIFWWIIGIGIGVSIVRRLIHIHATTYRMKEASFEYEYVFISKDQREFTADKLVLVILKDNPLDWLFNTCSLELRSIGADAPVEFQYIPKSDAFAQAVLAKTGVQPERQVHLITPEFSVPELVKGHLFSVLFFAALTLVPAAVLLLINPALAGAYAAALIALFLLLVAYKRAYYARMEGTFFESYMHLKRGLIFHEHYYLLDGSVRSVRTRRYIASTHGNVTLDIAGVVTTGSGRNKTTTANSFKLAYVPSIETKDELIDLLLYRSPTPQQAAAMEQNIEKYREDPLFTAKPHIPTVVVSACFSFVVPLVVSFFSLPWGLGLFGLFAVLFLFGLIAAYRTTFYVEPNRVLRRYGIFYRKQESVARPKVDFIQWHEGLSNKVCSSGNVMIETTGGLTALFIGPVKEYKACYELIRKQYAISDRRKE